MLRVMVNIALEAPSPTALHPRTPSVRKEVQEEVQSIQKFSKTLLADPVKRRKFLQNAGILGKDGKLARKYR